MPVNIKSSGLPSTGTDANCPTKSIVIETSINRAKIGKKWEIIGKKLANNKEKIGK